jgi:hypothetical protein
MSSSAAYIETPAATMGSAFPKLPDPSLGTPNLFVLNDLLQYMCKCAQTHKSPISKKMNLLYVTIDDTLYAHYAGGEAYPNDNYPFPDKPADVPDYTGAINANARAAIKTTHDMAQTRRNDVINMNTALIDAFLDLIPWRLSNLTSRSAWKTPTWCSARCSLGSSPSMGARLLKIMPPIATQWPSISTPRKGLSSLLRAYFAAPPLRILLNIPSLMTTSLTSGSASSIAPASLPKNTRHGSRVAMTPQTR